MSQISKKMILPVITVVLLLIGLSLIKDSSLDHYRVNENLHVLLESVGAFSLILVSILLFTEQNQTELNSGFIIIGLFLMGTLDLFHGMTTTGQSFVFLHNIAGVLGGLGFLFFVIFGLIDRLFIVSKILMLLVLLLAVLIGVSLTCFNENLPLMLVEGEFTPTAIWMNIITGLMFLVSAIYFINLYFRKNDPVKLLFILNTVFLGVSSLTFQYSNVWSTAWWGWHFIRFFGNILLIIFVFIVAEERRKKILTQNTEITDINKKLNNYTYTISHDLKEPIRSIRTFSEFIEEDYMDSLDETGLDYFRRIIDASDRMALMIDDLLLLSKIGKNDIKFEPVSLQDIVDEVVGSLAHLIEEHNVVIECGALPEIQCQIAWMKLVFINLINNCIKYRDDEKPELKISITSVSSKDSIEVSIRDNGIGIEEEQFDKIFGLFRRAYSKKDKTGSGAGLAIVTDIISQHNGEVWVKESKVGEGTVMSFKIPNRS